MTRPEQKESERWFVERLLRALDLPGVGELREGDPAPDYLVEWNRGAAGIEVTQVFRPDEELGLTLQALESARDRLFSEAAGLWEDSQGGPVHVIAHVSHVHPRRVSELAHALFRLVRDNLPDRNDSTRIDLDSAWPREAPAELHSLSIIRSDRLSRSHWSGAGASLIPPLGEDTLRDAIAKKALKSYTSGDGESWLLVVMDSFAASGMFDLERTEADWGCFETQFDRLYLLDAFGGQVWELTVCG